MFSSTINVSWSVILLVTREIPENTGHFENAYLFEAHTYTAKPAQQNTLLET